MPIEKADLRDGFARTSLTLLWAWACTTFSGLERNILDIVVASAWGRADKKPGYVSMYTRADLVSLFTSTGISAKSGVYKALVKILERQVLVMAGEYIAINPHYPAALNPNQLAFMTSAKHQHRLTMGSLASTFVENPDPAESPKVGGNSTKVGGNSTFVESPSMKPGLNKKNRVNISSSSSYVKPEAPLDSPKPQADQDDDDEFQELESETTPEAEPEQPEKPVAQTHGIDQDMRIKLYSALCARALKLCPGKAAVELAGELSGIQWPDRGQVDYAVAQILAAMRDGAVSKIRTGLRGLVIHALQNPHAYPQIEIAAVLGAELAPKPKTGPSQEELRAMADAAHREKLEREQRMLEQAAARKKQNGEESKIVA